MKKFNRFSLLTTLLGCSLFISAQTTIASWDFEAVNATPTSGSGTITSIGGISTTFDLSKGVTSGASTTTGVLETSLTLSGYPYSTTIYPAQGTSEKTAGIQIAVSTSGYKDISISFDARHGNKCANTMVVQHTINGTDWVDDTAFVASVTNDTWFARSYDFSKITDINNNTSFAIRIVSAFAAGTSTYSPSNSTSTYDNTKGYRFDNIILKGTAVIDGVNNTKASDKWVQKGNTISFGAITNTKIEVVDINGIIIAKFNPNSEVTLKLPQGIYIIKANNNTKKIFIQ